MQDIASKCYNTGDCQLTDVMTVVNNVGVFILGIVGALVFLMYTISGVRWIGAAYLPGGFDENIKKGKDGLRIATIGLVIVFIAFAAITTLRRVFCAKNANGECVELIAPTP